LGAIRDDQAKFAELETATLGISGDSIVSHQRWAAQMKLNFPLLVDAGHQVARVYGAARGFAIGSVPTRRVVVVDKSGVIRYLKDGMPGDEELLEAIRGFGG
jgi:peroxiredoxin Q/BCP